MGIQAVSESKVEFEKFGRKDSRPAPTALT